MDWPKTISIQVCVTYVCYNTHTCLPDIHPHVYIHNSRWTRVLLFQQQLVDTIDLLDPDCVRLPMERRVRLRYVRVQPIFPSLSAHTINISPPHANRPISYEPLPRVEEYHRQLRELSVATASSKGQSPSGDAAGKVWRAKIYV